MISTDNRVVVHYYFVDQYDVRQTYQIFSVNERTRRAKHVIASAVLTSQCVCLYCREYLCSYQF